MNMLAQHWKSLKSILQMKSYAILAIATFIVFLLIYLLVLPASVLGSNVGINSFSHLSPTILLFATSLAGLVSVVFPVNVYLIRHRRSCATSAAVGGVMISIVTPLLCCSPLLPFLLSIFATVWPAAPQLFGIKIQYIVNVYQTEFFTFSVALLLVAFHQNIKRINLN